MSGDGRGEGAAGLAGSLVRGFFPPHPTLRLSRFSQTGCDGAGLASISLTPWRRKGSSVAGGRCRRRGVSAGLAAAVPELPPPGSARTCAPEVPQQRGRPVLGLGQRRDTGASLGRPEGGPVELPTTYSPWMEPCNRCQI